MCLHNQTNIMKVEKNMANDERYDKKTTLRIGAVSSFDCTPGTGGNFNRVTRTAKPIRVFYVLVLEAPVRN